MILLLLLAGCQEADANAEIYGALGYVPTFEPAEFQFDVPPGYQAECGYSTVPEDRSQPEGPQIRLHIAIFGSTGVNPAPASVVHLVGGPGASLADSAAFYLAQDTA